MVSFLCAWDETVASAGVVATEELKTALFLQEVGELPEIAEDLAHYRRKSATDPTKNYGYLREAIDRMIERQRENKVRSERLALLNGVRVPGGVAVVAASAAGFREAFVGKTQHPSVTHAGIKGMCEFCWCAGCGGKCLLELSEGSEDSSEEQCLHESSGESSDGESALCENGEASRVQEVESLGLPEPQEFRVVLGGLQAGFARPQVAEQGGTKPKADEQVLLQLPQELVLQFPQEFVTESSIPKPESTTENTVVLCTVILAVAAVGVGRCEFFSIEEDDETAPQTPSRSSRKLLFFLLCVGVFALLAPKVMSGDGRHFRSPMSCFLDAPSEAFRCFQ